MANVHQPLLSSVPKTSSKTIYLALSLIAIIGSTLLCFRVFNSKNFNLNTPIEHQICNKAHDKASCLSMVSELTLENQPKDASTLLQIFLKKSTLHVENAIKIANNMHLKINDHREQEALGDCIELLDLSMDRSMDSIQALEKGTIESHADAHAWLSSILTNHMSCLDGLKGLSSRTSVEPTLNDLVLRARASLAMIVTISSHDHQDLLKSLRGKLPPWVTAYDRKLLMSLPKDIKPNVVVAKDGSGKHKTVKEAVDAAPDNSKTRYVIYVKQGTYKENVEIGKKKKNVMLVGDGMDKTIITGSLNFVDGTTTFRTATVAAVGDGFIAQDIWFQNTAGPQKHQAVALRVGADQSVINRCRIDAYQDTLYAHSLRQFYRDCDITGTVDFIFGNAAVVLQNCKIVARKPMDKQSNMVTAQGREDPNQNTGTSIQNCNVLASGDLEPVKGKIKTYLGRPWKEYSRTVYMQSSIGDHIDPSGWSPWQGDFALKTLYYGEYMNKGPGAGTSKRVKWPGYHVITSVEEAKKFTVDKLIQGGSWLKSTGVAFTLGL